MIGKKRLLAFVFVLAAMAVWTVNVYAEPGFYSNSCVGCHTNPPAANQDCAGCHIHAVKSSRGSSSINLTATIDNSTSYAPGDPVTVRITGGNASGWGRYIIYDNNGSEVARSVSRTLTVPAPMSPGIYSYTASWYGHNFGESTFGDPTTVSTVPGYRPDANRSNHGEEIVATNFFEVVAPAPDINATPGALDFGTITMGNSSNMSTVVENQGASDLMVSLVGLCGGTSGEFAFSPADSFTVAAGGSQTVTVSYTPNDMGADTGCLEIVSNDPDQGTVEITLAGTGVAAPEPDINLVPAALDFGSINLGSGDSLLDSVVENLGTSPLTVTTSLCSATSDEFVYASDSFTVPVGGSQTLTVSYTPTDTIADSGCLEVVSNDPDEGTATIALTGTGVEVMQPDINLNPTSLDFGSVTMGDEISLEVVVQNLGTSDLTISAVDLCNGTSNEFVVSQTEFTVSPNSSEILTVSYTPTDMGMDTGCMEIISDDPDESTVEITLSGSGEALPTPDISVTPATLDFGDVLSVDGGNFDLSRDVLVQNLGTSDLTISAVDLCTGTSDEFTYSSAAPFTLSPGQSQTVTVNYGPVDPGMDMGCLEIVSNDPDEGTVSIELAGNGVSEPTPVIHLNPTALDFGAVTLGDGGSLSAEVQNSGLSELTVSYLGLCSGTSSEYGFSPASFTVPAGGSQTLNVSYTPEGVGTSNGCLEIVSDDPETPNIELVLSGMGAEAGTDLVDLDIIRLRVARWIELPRDGSKSIRVHLMVKNRGEFDAPRPATLIGVQNGQKIFSETQSVSDPLSRGITRFGFGPFRLDTTGAITWTVKIDDDHPDVDEAMAKTIVFKKPSDDDDEDDEEDNDRDEDDGDDDDDDDDDRETREGEEDTDLKYSGKISREEQQGELFAPNVIL